MSRELRGPILLAAAAAIAVSLGWAVRHPPQPVEGTDAAQYLGLASGLAQGRGLATWGGAWAPTHYREPGYPLFLAMLGGAGAPSDLVLILVQAALLGLTAAFVVLLARWSGLPRWWAAAAGALAGTALSLVDLARQPLSEVLAITLLMGSFTAFVQATRTHRVLWFGAAGILFGVATLVRAPVLAVGLGLLGTWGLVALAWRKPWRRVLVRAGLGCVLLGLVIAPWIARNWWQIDTTALTSRSGVGLLRRAVKAEYPATFQTRWWIAATWMAFNPLSDLVLPAERFQYARAYWQSYLWDFHTNESRWAGSRWDRVCRLSDLDRCEREVAVDIALHYPIAYLVQTPLEWVKLNFYPLPGGVAADRNLRVWFALIATVVLLMRGRLRGPLAWSAILVGLYTLVHLPFDMQERYGTPLLPTYALLMVAGAYELVSSRASRRATSPSSGSEAALLQTAGAPQEAIGG